MPADVVKFGDDLEIDRVAYELRRSGRPLKLERIPMEILSLLIERHGQLVSRDDIIERIWGKDVFLDTDNSINSAIRKIRQVLKDDPESPAFIQTVTGKGYRFIAPVPDVVRAVTVPEVLPTSDEVHDTAAPATASSPAVGPAQSPPRWIRSAFLLLLLVLLGLGVYLFRVRDNSHSVGAEQKAMLAVLPFANLSSDPEQEYFSEGLTEETITDLGELNPDRLGVIARTSSDTYKHTTKTISQIGQELGVDYVLEGSVRREGGVVRISAQLIRVNDQSHLWAHTYEREQGGLLAIQNELGRAIAQNVQVKLTSSYDHRTANQYVPNAEAYEFYLKGRFYMNERTWPEMSQSTDYFQQAIQKDPGFALAYAGLANSYLARAIASPQEFDPKAKAAAQRALELDGNLAEAHVALGAEKADFEYDWKGAEQEFKRALELNPNYAEAHSWYAWTYLSPQGKSEEAIAEMKKALELDPFSRIDNTRFGLTYFYARKYNLAEEQLDKAVRLNPDFFVTYYHRAWLYAQLGQYENAIANLTKGRLLAGDAGGDVPTKFAAANDVALKSAFASEGASGFWREMRKLAEKDGPEIGEFGIAQLDARIGDKDMALRELQRYYDQREALGTLVNVDPALDSLHSDPRFVNLVSRMGLTPLPLAAKKPNDR